MMVMGVNDRKVYHTTYQSMELGLLEWIPDRGSVRAL